ncbi:MAG: mercuric reductase [Phormidium tanganyikae FI6-MK23]|jgi:pyruvate/2-oxoglutarate dehydrogenase complex dihydrolipoamide dehydrogenase (E3) component|nr:mercuric reductase [Phormidium tanganyikae FI6-MK23]
MKDSLISPLDVHNELLISHVHPIDWVNPQPREQYDLVVIGAGTAGLVVAAGAAGLGIGLKVAIIEKHLMGGDCLNVGCVPSKTMIRSSRVVGEMQQARSFGVIPPDQIEVDFPAVMERMRRVRAGISENDSAQRFQALGIDVFLGEGKFLDRDRIAVGDQVLKFKKAAIATGARASRPEIPGLAEAGFLTNETVFSLTERPNRLAVIGGGSIGCEMAQTFRRLGCEVTLFHNKKRLLDREDPEAAEILKQVFLKEGIQLIFNSPIDKVEQTNNGKEIHFNSQQITVDKILVGAGRSPNVERLNLEAAGVEYDKKGVKINDHLQTSNPKIFAAGDICMNWKYTHAADAAARIVIKNALFSPFGFGRSKLSSLVMPSAIYTDPEIAQVGQHNALDAETIKIPLEKIDRAIADGETNGFVKILHKKSQILGATIVASHAGEMISEITLAIVGKGGLNTLSSVIHPYPTQAEAIRKAADTYRKTLLTPTSRKLLGVLTKFS